MVFTSSSNSQKALFDFREAAMQPGRKIGPDEIATAGICGHALTRALAAMASGVSLALGGRP